MFVQNDCPSISTIIWQMLVLLPGKSHGQGKLVGCSPWGRWGSDTTEWLHFLLSCFGEGNGNPLLCSFLENPRDGGAWWAAVYRVVQSRTRLKWLSSSSRSNVTFCTRQWTRQVYSILTMWALLFRFYTGRNSLIEIKGQAQGYLTQKW